MSALAARFSRLPLFRRALASTLALDVLGRALSAAGVVLLLRALPAADFAYLVLFLAVGLFGGSAATGGFRMRHLRTEAERVSRGGGDPSSFITALVGGTLAVAAAALLALAVAAATGAAGSLSEVAPFLGVAGAYAAGHAATELGVFHRQAHLAFGSAGAVAAGRGALVLAVGLAASAGLTDSGKLVAAALAGGMIALGAAVALPEAISARRAGARLEPRLGLGAESGSLTVYYLASAAFAHVDVFVIAAVLAVADVASFGAAQRYYAIVLGATPALIAVLRVRTAQQDIVDSADAQRALLVSWARRTVLPAAAVMGAVAVAAPFAIPLVDGGRYPDSIPVLEALLLAAFASYVTLPAPSILMAQRRFGVLAALLAGGLAVNLVGDIAAASLFGVVGVAAWAAAVYAAVALLAACLALGERPLRIVRHQIFRARPGPE